MTHILFIKNEKGEYDNNVYNEYDVYGLYYHNNLKPNKEQIQMITQITQINENASPQSKRYNKNNINSKNFWDESRYFIVGELNFVIKNNIMFINHFNTWYLESGSGLKMLCTILFILYLKFKNLKIKLVPGTIDVFTKFYEKIGFKYENKYFVVLEDIIPLINEKCIYCSKDVKLIVKNYKTNVENLENMIQIIE